MSELIEKPDFRKLRKEIEINSDLRGTEKKEPEKKKDVFTPLIYESRKFPKI